MVAPAAPDEGKITVNGATYDLAQDSSGAYLHSIIASGRDLREEWDFRSGSLGMGETSRVTPTGYYFTDNMDCTGRGLRLSPTIKTISTNVTWPTLTTDLLQGRAWWFEEVDANDIEYLYLTVKSASTTIRTHKLRLESAISTSSAANPTTVTTTAAHGLVAGDVVVISGHTTAALNGTQTVASAPTSTTFTVAVLGGGTGGVVEMFVIAGTNQPLDETVDASNSPGRPERFNGSWFRCEGGQSVTSGRGIQRLTTVDPARIADTWTAHGTTTTSVGMLLRESVNEGTQRLLRQTNTNKIQSVTAENPLSGAEDTPLTEANWSPSPGYPIGEGGTIYAPVIDGASHAGLTLLSKQDGIHAFDPAGNAYNLLEFLQKGNLRTYVADSGKGTLAFGELVFYPHATALYMIKSGRDIKRAGPDAIGSTPGSKIHYSSVPNITAPIKFRHYGLTSHGHWIYFSYVDRVNNNNSYIFAAQVGTHPSSGHPLVMHTIVKRANLIYAPYIDSDQKLVWGEPGQNRIGYMQLANDGSPDSSLRGNVSSTYEWYGSETDFGEPEITKQLRYLFVETEGGVATCSWQFKQYRDSGSAESIGSAITTAAATNINWTVGTTDTCRRWRPRWTATTDASFSTSTDPKILRMVAYARTADTWRTVIQWEALGSKKDQNEAEKVLRKLKNAGPITVREAGTNESSSVYIRAVNSTKAGIELLYDRFTAAA